MLDFHATRIFKLILVTLVLGLVPGVAFSAQSKITSWKIAGILQDFKNPPKHPHFRFGEPEVSTLDTARGELTFRITAKTDPGCTQVYRIGWVFEHDVGFVREGQSIRVQLFNRPVGDAGVGLKKCYIDAKARIGWGGREFLTFDPAGDSDLLTAPLRKYHEAQAQHLFSKTTKVGRVYGAQPGGYFHVQYALDGFRVDDSYPQKKHGSLSFVFSGVFDRYTVTYLFDAVKTPARPGDGMGQQWSVSESGWQGVWTRRGNSNIFDAKWGTGPKAITAVLTITITGNKVKITRRNSSDGNQCDYSGTIAEDGVTVEGTYTCTRYRGPFPWRAVIQR